MFGFEIAACRLHFGGCRHGGATVALQYMQIHTSMRAYAQTGIKLRMYLDIVLRIFPTIATCFIGS